MRCLLTTSQAILLLVTAACNVDGFLDTIDGGVRDAGPHTPPPDSGTHDQDAGAPPTSDGGSISPDAGDGLCTDGLIVWSCDAGPGADAGSACVFTDHPPSIPFTCEGDEDYCDTSGDAYYPSYDILAVWSRREAGELIIDIRFAALPFQSPLNQLLKVAFASPEPTGAEVQLCLQPSSAGCFDVLDVWEWATIGDFPDAVVRSARYHDVLDVCGTFYLSPSLPFAQFRLPESILGQSEPSLLALNSHVQLAPPPIHDGAWLLDDQMFSSLGGAPDETPNYVSICEMQCPW